MVESDKHSLVIEFEIRPIIYWSLAKIIVSLFLFYIEASEIEFESTSLLAKSIIALSMLSIVVFVIIDHSIFIYKILFNEYLNMRDILEKYLMIISIVLSVVIIYIVLKDSSLSQYNKIYEGVLSYSFVYCLCSSVLTIVSVMLIFVILFLIKRVFSIKELLYKKSEENSENWLMTVIYKSSIGVVSGAIVFFVTSVLGLSTNIALVSMTVPVVVSILMP